VKRKITDDKTIEEKTNSILKQLDEALVIVQRIAMELRPSLLDHDGLPAAIQAYLADHCPRAAVDCQSDIDPDVQVEPACGIALFRIVQEAFTNILRHAKATKMNVCLKQMVPRRLVVCDNGSALNRAILQPSALDHRNARAHSTVRGTVTFAGLWARTTVTVVVPRNGSSDRDTDCSSPYLQGINVKSAGFAKVWLAREAGLDSVTI
jgi:signal transduction histidine kinase